MKDIIKVSIKGFLDGVAGTYGFDNKLYELNTPSFEKNDHEALHKDFIAITKDFREVYDKEAQQYEHDRRTNPATQKQKRFT